MKHKLLSLFFTITVSAALMPFFAPQQVGAVAAFEAPAITTRITYNFDGIAGPAEQDPDFWDELVIPAFLIGPDDRILHTTFTKINYGESNSDFNSQNDTAVIRFIEIPSGTYQSCITLAVPAAPENYLCSAQFDYTEGTDFETNSLNLTADNTFEAIEAGRAFDINGPPCPGTQIGWIVCPLVEELFDTVRVLFLDVFRSLLVIDPLDEQAADGTAGQAVFEIWNSFRVIANVLFFALFMVAVFGQGLAGFQLFSAYDFKKIMPRLVIAIIGIQLSWYIVGFMIDVFNILGGGVRGIILAPVEGLDNVRFEGDYITESLGIFVATGGLLSAFFAVGGVVGIIFLIPILFLNILMAVVFGVFVMLLRNSLILLGIVVSPVALALWALPNTEGLFRFWWDTMWRLLLMYPLIIALIAFGDLTSRLILAGNEANILWSLTSLVVLFAPFFAIPFTFRVAQNILGSVTTGLDGRRQLIKDRVFGSPEDEFSWRGRHRRQRGAYKVDRRWRSYNKHFVSPGNQVGLRGEKRRVKGIPGTGVLPTRGGSSKRIRTSWKRGYFDGVGLDGVSEPSRRGSNQQYRFGRKRGQNRDRESVGSYLASLPRFAMRTPGRAWARAQSRYGQFFGTPGIDDIMGQKNRAARERVQRAAAFGGGEDEAWAVLGSEYNPITGKRLSNAAIQAGRRHMNNDSEVQERMKLLVHKTAGNAYRRQILMDYWSGYQTPFVPAGVHGRNERLEPFLFGMRKGVAFGTQGVHRDTKHRNEDKLRRGYAPSMDRFNRNLDEIPEEERELLLRGAGLLEDRKISGFLGEAANNLRDRQQAQFSPTNTEGFWEASNRMYDLARIEAGNLRIAEAKAAAEAAAGRELTEDEVNKLSVTFDTHEIDVRKLRQKDQIELRKLAQPRIRRVEEKDIRSDVNRLLPDSDPRKLSENDLGKMMFNDTGEPVLDYNEEDDRKGMSNKIYGDSIKNLASLRAMAMDTMAQGDTGVDEGDDDSIDVVKPEAGADELARNWRRTGVAESIWADEFATRTGSRPTAVQAQQWRADDGPNGRARFMERRADDIFTLQQQREQMVRDNAGTQQLAEYNRDMMRKFSEASSWINDPKLLRRLNDATKQGGSDRGIIGTDADVDDILRDR